MQQTHLSDGTPLVCRPAHDDDLAACAAIEACVEDGWSEASLRAELEQASGRIYVAEAGGVIAGLAVFQLVCGEANLYAVSVSPARRRRGVASALLHASFAMLQAENAQTVFLEVRAQNRAAHALYESMGFVRTGLRKRFYANPVDDAVLMQKML